MPFPRNPPDARRRRRDRTGPARPAPGWGVRSGRHRFLEWDDYRVEREWKRYDGTPLRDLFRELRERFLARHRPTRPGRSLEVGPGPGRFTRLVGHPEDRVSLLELSRAMLERIRIDGPIGHRAGLDLIQGDAVSPPFRPRTFHRVILLGNVLGFAEDDAEELLSRLTALVSPGGRVLIEFVAGPGERSRYLHRLPPGAIARLLAAPVRAVRPRVEREGFVRIRERESGGRHFRRFAPAEVVGRLRSAGFELREILAVAPGLGNDAGRLGGVRAAPVAWGHLLELEEALGGEPHRHEDAAAILLAAERTQTGAPDPHMRTIK
ncbi:MAG: class I SAM-dependent methyltransferase [Thermoplasmata archaeon]|nr:class I SAM-dependent methyltransferase [Thermoplasmata archaeon]